MELYSAGIDFTLSPELFSHLQNRDGSFLMHIHSVLLRRFRFPFIFLLTCDRAEVIAEGRPSIEPVERALSLNPAAVKQFRYEYGGDEALSRIFLLSSGILSPLFGEDTIQSQMTAAAEAASLSGTASPALRKLFSSAVAFSKSMHTEMNTRVFDRTIAEAVARRIGKGRSVLIIGSGEGARTAAECLLPGNSVTMTLRDDTKTFLIPPGARHIPYDSRREALSAFDAVVSASSGLYHTLEENDWPLVEGKLLFDLSSPHDLPSSFNAIRVEDLSIPLPEREKVIAAVRAGAERAVAEFRDWKKKAEIAGSVHERAESIASNSIRRSADAISSLRLDSEKEKAFREALYENIRKAAVSELIARKS